MENESRRAFLSKLVKAGALVGLYPLVQSCTKNGLSPFAAYTIDQANCVGCGDCLTACRDKAIILPEKSIYQINAEDCVECGKCFSACTAGAIQVNFRQYFIDNSICTECGECVPVCTYNALKVDLSVYAIDGETCVGCGDCITVCQTAGDCIVYEKAEYSAKGKCKNQSCNNECIAACPYGAITKVGGVATFNMDLCTRCGACVPACPHEAINPAKVEMDSDLCSQCGKCFLVCTHNAVLKTVPETYTPAHVDGDLCESCGDCLNICAIEAIKYQVIGDPSVEPHIDQDSCTRCGDCYPVCDINNAIERDLKTAQIIEDECTVCGNCVTVCTYNAIHR